MATRDELIDNILRRRPEPLTTTELRAALRFVYGVGYDRGVWDGIEIGRDRLAGDDHEK